MSKEIQEFQKLHGLTADGDLGPKTFSFMKSLWKLSNEELCHLLGQCSAETGDFSLDEENLNYSAEGLVKIFGKYFTSQTAAKYARKPEAIANRVYANRYGNGPESSGDGYKYRGRGAIQTTFKANYKAFSDYIKEDCVANPSLLEDKYYFESALFFFKKNNILPLCKTVTPESIKKVSLKVNGGLNGFEERLKDTLELYAKFKTVA